MADPTITFKTDLEYTFYSRKFSTTNMTEFISGCFLSYHVVLDYSRLRPIHIFEATRFLHTGSARECRESRVV